MSYGDDFQKLRGDVCEALNDHGLTIGAKVPWPDDFYGLLFGNLANDDPALSQLAIDDLGRIWKERHHGGSHELVCVLDLRTLGPVGS